MAELVTPPEQDLLRLVADLDRRTRALERLPSGLQSIGTQHLAKIPAVRVSRVAALTHTTTGTYQTIAFDTEHFDTAGMWSPGAPTGVTITTPGIHRFSTHILFSTAAGSIVEVIIIQVNGVDIAQHNITSTAGGFDGLALDVTAPVVAGDFVRVLARQDSGGNLTYNVGSQFNYFQAEWISNP
jgi:hypothetical protein